MRSVTTFSALVAGLSLAVGALAQTGQQSTTPSTGSTQATRQQPATADKADKADKAIAKADRDFMRQAAQNGLAEVEASKLAQQKATQADVKSFAAKMIADHTKANEDLKKLASSKSVTLPDEPSLVQRAKLKMLSGADGEKFDKRYAEDFGVKAHEDTIKMFRKAAEEAKDADVKAFAQKTLASLQEHLTTAKAMHASVEPAAAGKGDGRTSTANQGAGEKAEKKQ